MFFKQVADERLAQYAYVVGCQRSGEALVVDPQRDVDRYLDAARREGLRITAAAETHVHADFLSGCRELVERHGCKAYVSGEGGAEWRCLWAEGRDRVVELRDGQEFSMGGVRFQAVHTPGHTPEHMSLLVTDEGAGAQDPMGMMSGDFVFVGDLGRPDLLESAAGQAGAMEPSARQLYASAQGVFRLPEYLRVWPGHGAGSACGKALGAVPDTTVGYETRCSPALAAVRRGEEAFLDYILDGQPEPPFYFGRMKTENRRGPALLGELPRPRRLEGAELATGPDAPSDDASGAVSPVARPPVRRPVARRPVVLDMRGDRMAYYAAHVPGAVYAPLNKAFPVVAGSYLEPDQPIALLCLEAEVEEAVRSLVRIGLDHIVGWAPPAALDDYRAAGRTLASTEVVDLAEARRRQRDQDSGACVVDVRRASEYANGHIEGAINIAHTRLAPRLNELPRDKRLVVHCLSGARASAAVSFLEGCGFDATAVNDVFRP